MAFKLTKKQFKLALGQMFQNSKDDLFESYTVSKEFKGLTTSWTCRFDSAKLFNSHGLTTGKTVFFLTTCKN